MKVLPKFLGVASVSINVLNLHAFKMNVNHNYRLRSFSRSYTSYKQKVNVNGLKSKTVH